MAAASGDANSVSSSSFSPRSAGRTVIVRNRGRRQAAWGGQKRHNRAAWRGCHRAEHTYWQTLLHDHRHYRLVAIEYPSKWSLCHPNSIRRFRWRDAGSRSERLQPRPDRELRADSCFATGRNRSAASAAGCQPGQRGANHSANGRQCAREPEPAQCADSRNRHRSRNGRRQRRRVAFDCWQFRFRRRVGGDQRANRSGERAGWPRSGSHTRYSTVDSSARRVERARR